MNFKERNLAITDIETTGDIPGLHEILEIGLVVCHPQTFEIIETLNIKTIPVNIQNAIPKALECNGYKEEDWRKAVTLEEAIKMYVDKTRGCVFYSYNVTFDWGFMAAAFKETGIKDQMDFHRFDIMSMVFVKHGNEMENASLTSASKIFGIPKEPEPHQALNGAMQAYYVLKKLHKPGIILQQTLAIK